jgi:holo-ACP synthase
MSKVLDGPEVTLGQMLAAKEARAAAQQALLTAHPLASVLSVTLRIPGPVKTGHVLTTSFAELLAALRQDYAHLLLDERVAHDASGDCALLALAIDPWSLKQAMLAYESADPFCQLADLDVCYLDGGQLTQLSRSRMQVAPRPCLVCGGDAKACSRSRKHGLEAVYAVIDEIALEGVAI